MLILSIYGRVSTKDDEDTSSESVKRIDVMADTISITKEVYLRDKLSQETIIYQETFTIADISKISILQGNETYGPNVTVIYFRCKSGNCVSMDKTRTRESKVSGVKVEKKSAKFANDDLLIADKTQAEKILQAFKHLFALRGWQEKHDLF